MNILDAVILGIAQGLTEFLPVSSSGHLTLIRALRGQSLESHLAFDVMLHLATLLAVVIAFRQALWRLLTEDRRTIWLLGLATALLGVLLLPFRGGHLKDLVSAAGESMLVVGFGFLGTATLLGILTKLDRREGPSDKQASAEFSALDALLIGLLQLVAVIPGISRSGSTIAGARMRGGSPELSCEFAFLLAIPAIAGASLVEAKDIADLAGLAPLPVAVGFACSLLTGLASIALVRWLVDRKRFWIFIPYLLICAGLSFALHLGLIG